MKWRLLLVMVLFATSCAAPQPPEAWSVQRVTPTDDREEVAGVCDDVRTLALGSHANETTLAGTLEELAGIAALTGATAALPLLSSLGALVDDDTLTPHQLAVQQHDLLVLASRSIDDTTTAACGIPGFSALYATSGFPDCHFEMEIPIAAYTATGTPGSCTTQGRPDFLPCWSDDGDHLALDCVSDEIVTAVGDRWATAGEPLVVVIDRVDPDAPPAPGVISLMPGTDCAAVASLFLDGPTPNRAISDFERLRTATAGLSDGVRDLVDDFIAASANPPRLEEFDSLVAELDDATVDACGLPLMSAWVSITMPVDSPPCWEPTGVAYPAYSMTECG